MKTITFGQKLVMGVIILFIGAFVVSSIRGNIANAAEPENWWTEHLLATTTPTAPRAVFAIDMDNDGDNDVVSANSDWAADNRVVWYENSGGPSPSWAEHVIDDTLPYGTWLTDVFAIDIDDDDDIDVISAAMSGFKLAWYENLGGSPPSWTTHVLIGGALYGTTDTIPHSKGDNLGPSVFAIDVNDDSLIDILWGDGSDLAWYENLGGSPPSFSKDTIPNSLWTGAPHTSVFAIDIDHDNDIDVLAATIGTNPKLAWYENDGGSPPSWTEHIINETGAECVFAIDMDNDGDIDVLAGNKWLENDGSSPPSWTEHIISESSIFSVFAIDIDRDGDIDVLGAEGDVVFWYENDGGSPPSWTKHLVGIGSWIFPIDIDADCNSDIAAGWEKTWDEGKVIWFENPFHNVRITNISDVGNDQGKQVRIDWSMFPYLDTLVTHFTIFRRIDSLLFASLKVKPEIFFSKDYPPGQWEMVGTYPAYGETLYAATVPTLKDSTIADSMYWSVFFIRAGTDNPIVYFDSPVDSGYSVDNLSPSPPTDLFAYHEPAVTKLAWSATADLDFDYYTLYRGDTSGFIPDDTNLLGFTIDTIFVDSTAQLCDTFYYVVSATDFSGNESSPSSEAMGVRYITGDLTGDAVIDIGDVVCLINYLFLGVYCPCPVEAGDCNCDGVVDIGDVICLINYLFLGASPPAC